MFPDLTRDDVFRLETARLWLRWPRQSDVAAIVRLAGDAAVAEMTSLIPHPYPPEAADAFVKSARQGNADGTGLAMAIAPRREPASLIGVIGIGGRAGLPTLGYWLGVPYWGKGLATEAVRALVDAFFAYGDGRELQVSARVVNGASLRVIEKCGFVRTGSDLHAFPARGTVFPVELFRLDRGTWSDLQARSPAWIAAGSVASRRVAGSGART